MIATPTALPEVWRLEPTIHRDGRGYFFEAFNQARFQRATGCATQFVQDNQSHSQRGILRGLHYQVGAHAQDKLVRVLSGEIFDVAVDIRRGSPGFGRWVGEYLSAENGFQLWVPIGFAHGFVVTSESAEVLYKVSDYYDPASERAIRWDDQQLAIAWPDLGQPPTLAERDAAAPDFSEAELFP